MPGWLHFLSYSSGYNWWLATTPIMSLWVWELRFLGQGAGVLFLEAPEENSLIVPEAAGS